MRKEFTILVRDPDNGLLTVWDVLPVDSDNPAHFTPLEIFQYAYDVPNFSEVRVSYPLPTTQSAVDLETFKLRVRETLQRRGVDSALSAAEVDLCAKATQYGVGPGDTAYQIIDNRTPATSGGEV